MSMKQLKDALKIVWSHGEPVSWPYKTNYIPRTLLNEFYDDFERVIDEASCESNISVGPTCIYRSFDILVRAMMLHNKKDNQRLVQKVIDLITNMKSGDPFNELGGNLIYTLYDVKSKSDFDNDMDSEIVHQLLALLKSYAELLYFRFYDISQEIHGPYPVKQKGDIFMLTWNFRNLRPIELIAPQFLLPFERIDFNILYTSRVKICLDIYNHIYQTGSNLKENMISCNVTIDYKVVSNQELKQLKNILIESIKKLYSCRINLTDEQYMILYSKNLWYKLWKLSNSIKDFEFNLMEIGKDRICISNTITNYRILDLLF